MGAAVVDLVFDSGAPFCSGAILCTGQRACVHWQLQELRVQLADDDQVEKENCQTDVKWRCQQTPVCSQENCAR